MPSTVAEISSEVVIPVLVFVGFGVVVAVVVMFGIRQQRRAAENVAKLANDLGLSVAEMKRSIFGRRVPTAQGPIRGRTARLYHYTTGSGKNTTQWCAIAIAVSNPGTLTLRISRENLFTRAGRVFGVDDVATGDRAFDEKFYVKSNDPGYVRAALIPEIRDAVARVWEAGAHGSFAVDGGELKYAETGTFASERLCARFPQLVEVACDLAELVEARRG